METTGTISAAAAGAISAAFPLWMLVSLTVLAAGAWAGLRIVRQRLRPPLWAWAARAASAAFGVVGAWLALNLLARATTLGAPWSLWSLALLAGVGVEGILYLYRRECDEMLGRMPRFLGALRAAVVLIVVLMLAQPTLMHTRRQTTDRYVAVLADISASMNLLDTYPAALEKIRVATVLDPESTRRAPQFLDSRLEEFKDLAGRVDTRIKWFEWLGTLDAQAAQAQIESQKAELAGLVESVQTTGRSAAQDVKSLMAVVAPDATLRAALEAARGLLEGRLATATAAPLQLLKEKSASDLHRGLTGLAQGVQGLRAALGECAAELEPLRERTAEAWLAAAPPAEREKIVAVATATRSALARRLLAGDGSDSDLLGALKKKYNVRFFTFNTRAAETNAAAWLKAAQQAATLRGPEGAAAGSMGTDLGAALRLVAEAVPDRLSGVVILSDGRHTGGGSPEAAARSLAEREVPIGGIRIGSTLAPIDAAALTVDAPEALGLGDTLRARVGVKFDQLDGKQARISLQLAGQTVDVKTNVIAGASSRPEIELTHKPEKTGAYVYRVVIDPLPGEQLTTNNTLTFGVMVGDERIKLLLVDGCPRWESRYLRNLFAGRDRNVKLQYLLLEPDTVEGSGARPLIPASAARPPEEIEATALPENDTEWQKFDIVILGDVKSSSLGVPALESLRRFVNDRGGALVVIAGPGHMPAEYLSTPLADLLPLTFSTAPPPAGSQSNALFRIRVADAGWDHIVMKLDGAPDSNRAAWDFIPEMDWRYPVRAAKGGATVLAYADTGGAAPEETAAAAAARRAENERRNALIAEQRFGAGRVLMLTFDRTWRFRYWKGDLYHYKFWGQVMRWATDERLPIGTTHVRLGTDRIVYRPGQAVVVRASIRDRALNPVRSKRVEIEVTSGEEEPFSKAMAAEAGAPGMYRAVLEPPAPGRTYRLTLRSPEAERILKEDGFRGDLYAEVLVNAESSGELAEMSADASLLERLAALTGGAAAGPHAVSNVLARLGPGSDTVSEEEQIPLWNTWPVLAVLLALLTAEWWLRKKEGLV